MYCEKGGVFIKKCRNGTLGILRAWLVLLLIVSIIMGYIYYKMQPVILRYAESIAETTMLNSANQAIVNILKNEKINYNDIAILTQNKDGEIISLEVDTYKINQFKSLISNEISKIIADNERYTVSIPIGSFLANTYTTGFGPDINFKMQITTTAYVDFDHEFSSAGINQVLHRVVVKIKICGSLLVAGYKKTITVNTSALAAQTVIVGIVPENFTNVIENEDDNTAGLINDYGAVGE